MDAYGKSIVEPTGGPLQADQLAQDKEVITPELLKALQGQSSSGSLSDTILSPFAQRVYAVEPIYANGATQGDVVGAVALSSPPRVGVAAFAVFQTAMTRILLISALGAIVFAIIVAVLLSRRLTRPLARLTTATARMANGDYATRVDVRSPDEYRRLAATFNEMAAALEHDVNELQRQEQMRRDLVANVSHELKTPLTVVAGFLETLQDMELDARQRARYLQLMAEQARNMQRLVDDRERVVARRHENPSHQVDHRDPRAVAKHFMSAFGRNFEHATVEQVPPRPHQSRKPLSVLRSRATRLASCSRFSGPELPDSPDFQAEPISEIRITAKPGGTSRRLKFIVPDPGAYRVRTSSASAPRSLSMAWARSAKSRR
jgi:signal transduction histidine kinase